MPNNNQTLKLFAAHCRGLAISARTWSEKDKYLDMAVCFEREAEVVQGYLQATTGSTGDTRHSRRRISR